MFHNKVISPICSFMEYRLVYGKQSSSLKILQNQQMQFDSYESSLDKFETL